MVAVGKGEGASSLTWGFFPQEESWVPRSQWKVVVSQSSQGAAGRSLCPKEGRPPAQASPYKQEVPEDGGPLLSHQLIDNSVPEGAGPMTSSLFAGGPAAIALSSS